MAPSSWRAAAAMGRASMPSWSWVTSIAKWLALIISQTRSVSGSAMVSSRLLKAKRQASAYVPSGKAKSPRGQPLADLLRMFGVARLNHQFQGGGLGGNARHHAVVRDFQHIAAGIGDDA